MVKRNYVLGDNPFHDDYLGYIPCGRDGLGFVTIRDWGIPLWCVSGGKSVVCRYCFGCEAVKIDMFCGTVGLDYMVKAQDIGSSYMVGCFVFSPTGGLGVSCKVAFDFGKGSYYVRTWHGSALSGWKDLVSKQQLAKRVMLGV